MITVKDLAMKLGKNSETIYKHLRNHSEEFKDHRFKKPEGTYLDEIAVELLEKYMLKDNITVFNNSLEAEVERLRRKLEEKQDKIEELQGSITKFIALKTLADKALEDNEQKKILLESAELQLREQEKKIDEIKISIQNTGFLGLRKLKDKYK